MVQRVKELAVLPGEPSLVPKTHIRWHKIAVNPVLGNLMLSSVSCKFIYTYHIHSLRHKNKKKYIHWKSLKLNRIFTNRDGTLMQSLLLGRTYWRRIATQWYRTMYLKIHSSSFLFLIKISLVPSFLSTF